MGPTLPTSDEDWGSPLPHLRPGLGSALPHLRPGLGSPLPHLRPGLGPHRHVEVDAVRLVVVRADLEDLVVFAVPAGGQRQGGLVLPVLRSTEPDGGLERKHAGCGSDDTTAAPNGCGGVVIGGEGTERTQGHEG
jgi:hypothetical protein